MRTFLICVLLVTLSGCSTVQGWICPDPEIQYVERITEVYVPVNTQCPVPKDLPYMELPINSIDKSFYDKPNEVGKAYILSIRMLQQRVDDQKQLLDVYRNQDGKDQVK